MLIVPNALLMSSATVIVRSGGLFWLKPVAMVLLCTKRIQPARGWCATVRGTVQIVSIYSRLSGGPATPFLGSQPCCGDAYSLPTPFGRH